MITSMKLGLGQVGILGSTSQKKGAITAGIVSIGDISIGNKGTTTEATVVADAR